MKSHRGMRWVEFLRLTICSLGIAAAQISAGKPILSPSPCGPPNQNEEFLYSEDFHWNMTMEEIETKFTSIYSSQRRLKGRAYWDNQMGSYILPLDHGGEIQKVKIGETFISSVSRHIEKALQLSLAKAVIFPDMGHSHLLIPEDYFNREILPLPNSQTDLAYEKMLNSEKTKFLYHTAEQLKMKDAEQSLLSDRFLQWRFYTRNLVGDNFNQGLLDIHSALDSKGNTANERHFPHFRWWGAGFNLSASQNGCFAYQSGDQTFYYDISLEDLPLRDSSPYQVNRSVQDSNNSTYREWLTKYPPSKCPLSNPSPN